MMMKKIFLTALCGISLAGADAQDIHFAQFNETPLLINPASTGSGYDLRAILNYRDQWRSVTVPYKTFAASFEMKLYKNSTKKGNLGFGMYAFNDKTGTSKLSTTQLTLAVAGMLALNRNNTISAGLSGGYNQRSITTGSLRWDTQYNNGAFDPGAGTFENFADERFGYADLNAGIQWNYGQGERYLTANDEVKANFGISFSHINRPMQKFYTFEDKLYSRVSAHGGLVFGIANTNLLIAPSFVYHHQGPQREVMAGSMFKFKMAEDSKYTGFKKGACISLGGYYRLKDAFVFCSQFEFGQYSLGVSYDMNVSGLTQASNGRGGFEISLRFVSPNPYLFKSVSRM
jgi:type IX secretion system PorP/SprF family membrane protein